MTELTTAPDGEPLADDDIFLVRKGTVAGLKKFTGADLKAYLAAAGIAFPPFVGNAGKFLVVNDEEDAVEWVALEGEASFYNFGGFFVEKPKASEILMGHIAVEAFSLPINFAGSQFDAMFEAANPTANTTFSVKKNGVEIGTILVTNAGVVTLTAAALTNFAIGDICTVNGPAVADASIAGWVWTFKGTL